MQQVYISYNSQLCLKSKHTQKYVGIQTSTQILKSDYPPAWIQVKTLLKSQKQERQRYTLRIKVVSRDQEKSEFIVEGSKVHLINTLTDEYVTCSSTGEIKFDKKSTISEEVNKHLYKASTWTVQFLKNQNKVIMAQKEFISVYDQLCFKSVHSTFLTLKPGNLELSASTQLDPTRSVWSLIKANVPFIPQWAMTRTPFKKFSKVQINPEQENFNNQLPRQKKLLKSLPPEKQQILLIEDLFDVMLGFDAVYIKRHKTLNQFIIEPHLEQPSCTLANKQLTQKILAMPVMYFKVETYVNTYGMQEGILCQALCGGLRKMMKEYQMMVCQFNEETRQNGMTLQKLWYLIQSPLKIMQALHNLVFESEKCRGGQIITILAKLLNECTDSEVVEIYNALFGCVMQVYIQMLSKWLYEGVVEDKYGEFMIKIEEKSVNKEWSYWEEKFMIREDMVPSIFSREANQILVTGKYLNILKACNKVEEYPDKREIFLHLQRYIALKNFSEDITKAYEWTNKQMLELVFNDCKLEEVLKSIKGYFFMEYGDLFVHLMDAAADDLGLLKNKKVIEGLKMKIFSEQKIQNLFELLIRTSSANNDPFKDDVSCRVENISIYEQVHRIKAQESEKLSFDYLEKPFVKKDSKYSDFFTLDYKCQFPLTLIFNKKSMSKYQVLFRLLFWCKSIERQLNAAWLTLQPTKKVFLPCFTPAYLLNQRMINFIKNFIYYICYEVIEENWLVFTQNLERVKTFEDIIECHTNFLNKCIVESLLSNSKLLTIITSEVGKGCQSFALIKVIIEKLFENFNFQPVPTNPKTGNVIEQRRLYLDDFKARLEEQIKQEEFKTVMEETAGTFDDSMRKLLREVYEMIGKQQNHLINLVNRLDEERFYNKRLFGNNMQIA